MRRIITYTVAVFLLLSIPMRAEAAEIPQTAQSYQAAFADILEGSPVWKDKMLVLQLGEHIFVCRLVDLGAMTVQVTTAGEQTAWEITDPVILHTWLHTVSMQLAVRPVQGNEIVFDPTTGIYRMAVAGERLFLRDEFKELMKQGIQIALRSSAPASDIRINLNEGFLTTYLTGGANDIAASCTTTLKGSSNSRIHNVTLAAQKFNNYVIQPGQIISVSDIMLPRTPANGYEMAGSYLNGEVVPAYGGGICQVSSTLYNAAMNAGLTVTQRYSHSMPVSYLPLGLDATISAGSKDLQIRNDYPLPVVIKAEVLDRQLTMCIMLDQELMGGKTYALWSEIPKRNVADTYFSTYIGDVEVSRVSVGRSVYKDPKQG